MAGQVDIIISKQAMAEIDSATAKLEVLRKKVLQVNQAGAKTKGVENNDRIVQEIQKTNALIASQKKLISTKQRTAKAYVGSAKALMNEISALKKEQLTLTTSNKSWLQYEMRIMKVQGKLRSLTKTQSQVSVATRKSSKSVGSFSKSLGGMGGILKGGGILFALSKLKDLATRLVSNVFDLAKQFDSLRFALERTSSSLLEAKMNSAFMLKLSSDLGLSLIATTTRFIKFSAAARNSGLAMRDVQKIFGTMAKAGAVLGLRTDELSGVFLALEQMLSKGKVTTEELRRQLGERLPGAFGIMAASLGVTLPKLDEMLKKGELLSADVLPGFADAVEQAFGLDTVEKVDTLVAAQNRLTTAWQNFVKNITGEESTIKRVFKFIFESIEDSINVMDSYVNSKEFFNASFMDFGFSNETEIIKRTSKELLDATKEEGKKFADLQEKAKIAAAEIGKKVDDKIAEEKLRVAVDNVLKYNKELQKIEKEEAKKRFNESFVEYEEQKKIVEDLNAELLKATNSEPSLGVGRRGNRNAKADREKELLAITNKLTKQTRLLNQAEGKLNADRLLAESTTPTVIEDKKTGSGTKISSIDNLDNKLKAEQLKSEIAYIKKKIEIIGEGDKTVIDKLVKINEKEKLIEGFFNQDKLDKLKESIEGQKAENDKYLKDGVISSAKHKNRLIEIKKLETNSIGIITEQARRRELKINESFTEGLVRQEKASTKDIETIEDAKLTKAKESAYQDYLVALKTTNDKKKLKKEYLEKVTELERVAFNAKIDFQVTEMENLALILGAESEYTKLLEKRIEILKGTKKKPKGEEDDESGIVKTEKEKFEEMMGFASAYADALTDLSSGIFDNKIADIDAEIEATRLKYDEMFLLAEGDAKQTKLLRVQEARDLEKLERKKKKLQRQKAIFEKANAIIQIGINTVVAASRVTAETGLLGIPLLPLIYGLGALQTAAVLAQPLPKFAQGGTMGHDGLAVVGDGGKQEVIRTPDGKVSLTPSTDTVVNLEKGTEIFSSVEKFNQQNPAEMSNLLHSASLLASISLNQKNINGMMSGQKQLDERLLDAMLLNTKAVKKSQSNTYVKTQKIDIAHELWKSNLLN